MYEVYHLVPAQVPTHWAGRAFFPWQWASTAALKQLRKGCDVCRLQCPAAGIKGPLRAPSATINCSWGLMVGAGEGTLLICQQLAGEACKSVWPGSCSPKVGS